jgi:RNA polymerase sigma-70 factor (ECF subfamily)
MPENEPIQIHNATVRTEVRANPITSVSLLQRARNCDDEAWRRLFYLYRPMVEYWCSHWHVQPTDADDVVQEVFRAAAAGLDSFRREGPGDTFRGWLRGITHNRVLMHFRAAQRHPQGAGGSEAQMRMQEISDQLQADTDDPADQISSFYTRALELVRSEFEDKTWQMFWRTVVESQLPAVVATEMSVSPAAVRQAKSRVLRRLKEEVGDVIEC